MSDSVLCASSKKLYFKMQNKKVLFVVARVTDAQAVPFSGKRAHLHLSHAHTAVIVKLHLLLLVKINLQQQLARLEDFNLLGSDSLL